MKAKVKLALPGYAGNMDDMVIYYNTRLNCLVARRKVTPKSTPSNACFRAAVRLAKTLGLSEGYIGDCRGYVLLYNRQNKRKGRSLNAWTNVFIRLLLGVAKQYPELDLATLTKQEIISQGYPCSTIRQGVEAGLLEKVNGFRELTAQM
jgi:hypothetical protein